MADAWFDDRDYIDYKVTEVRDEGRAGMVYQITDERGDLQGGWRRTDVVPIVGDYMRVFHRCWGMAVRGRVLFRHEHNWDAVVDFYKGKHDWDVANGDPDAGPGAREWWAKRRKELGVL